MQEELERKSISVTVQATKLTGRVMRAAIAAALRKIEKKRNTPKVGRNSMRRLTAQTPDAHKIEVEERIRSFERYALTCPSPQTAATAVTGTYGISAMRAWSWKILHRNPTTSICLYLA